MCAGNYAQHYLGSQLLRAKDRVQSIFSDALLAEQTPDWRGYLLEKRIFRAKVVQIPTAKGWWSPKLGDLAEKKTVLPTSSN